VTRNSRNGLICKQFSLLKELTMNPANLLDTLVKQKQLKCASDIEVQFVCRYAVCRYARGYGAVSSPLLQSIHRRTRRSFRSDGFQRNQPYTV
jgi:hypothetical protein